MNGQQFYQGLILLPDAIIKLIPDAHQQNRNVHILERTASPILVAGRGYVNPSDHPKTVREFKSYVKFL